MKRTLEMLLGALFASALVLGGCVASSESDDADETAEPTTGEARAAVVGSPSSNDATRDTSGTDPGGSSIVMPGTPGMSDPQPQPWKPPPSGPPTDPSTTGKH